MIIIICDTCHSLLLCSDPIPLPVLLHPPAYCYPWLDPAADTGLFLYPVARLSLSHPCQSNTLWCFTDSLDTLRCEINYMLYFTNQLPHQNWIMNANQLPQTKLWQRRYDHHWSQSPHQKTHNLLPPHQQLHSPPILNLGSIFDSKALRWFHTLASPHQPSCLCLVLSRTLLQTTSLEVQVLAGPFSPFAHCLLSCSPFHITEKSLVDLLIT